MKVIAQLKLHPTPDQAAALDLTLTTANAAWTYISDVAWDHQTFKQYDLQKRVYRIVRDHYGLSAQMTVRCVAKVGDAYKLNTQTKRTFKPHGASAYDSRILSFRPADQTVSIWTMHGRIRVPFVGGARQWAYLRYQQGESDLVCHKGTWYLLATCDLPDPDEQEVDGVLGVDLGITNLAVDSDGHVHTGDHIEQQRQWYATRRQRLQQVGTKSTKRRLKKLAGRQRRFQRDINHCISKHLVAKAQGTRRALALEDLKHIRQRTEHTVRHTQRSRHSNWAFAQLRQFLTYKARMVGIPVYLVDAAYTSQTCCVCGFVSRDNRKSQSLFWCGSCGASHHADSNAAGNIAYRAACHTAYGFQFSD
ncbi:MAG: IS200/IS605 family element transposase accessory protein TnpB [Blastochloris sp.]|nr:IS200/IS605 family element transposase accessory protein TnpB [Blastochloris sp.]